MGLKEAARKGALQKAPLPILAPHPKTGAPLTCGLAEEVEGPKGMHVLCLVTEEGWQQGDPGASVRP